MKYCRKPRIPEDMLSIWPISKRYLALLKTYSCLCCLEYEFIGCQLWEVGVFTEQCTKQLCAQILIWYPLADLLACIIYQLVFLGESSCPLKTLSSISFWAGFPFVLVNSKATVDVDFHKWPSFTKQVTKHWNLKLYFPDIPAVSII